MFDQELLNFTKMNAQPLLGDKHVNRVYIIQAAVNTRRRLI